METEKLYERGLALEQAGKLAEAIECYRRIILTMTSQLESNKKSELELQRVMQLHQMQVSVILERYKILPQRSTLSAALIGLITFNGDFIKIQWLSLLAFIIMLLLIPFSIALLLYQLERDVEHIDTQIKRSFLDTPDVSGHTNPMGPLLWILWLFFFVSITFLIISFV